MDRALAMVIEAQAQLPMSGLWGLGLTASSDGQFFTAARHGEAMNLVNAHSYSSPHSYFHSNSVSHCYASTHAHWNGARQAVV